MTTLSQITNRAYRESQILSIDTEPTAEQTSEAVTILQGIIARHTQPPTLTVWLGNITDVKPQKGGILPDFTPYVENIALPQGVYLNCYVTQSYEIMLPPSPGDGARITVRDVSGSFATYPLTLDGNGNFVNGSATDELNTNSQVKSYMFRRDLADWTVVSDLAAGSSMPYPEEFDDMFVIELAMRLNPRYGSTISDVSAEMYRDMRSRFKSRYQIMNSSAAPDDLFFPVGFSTSGNGWTF